MKLIFQGRFDGNPESIPCKEHREDYVKFKEFDNLNHLSVITNILSSILAAAAIIGFILRCNIQAENILPFALKLLAASILAMLFLLPHELLHAICFRETVYFYTYLEKGLLFVVGPEDMSKSRFIFMSLLPNIVLGLIPYIIAMINPSLIVLGFFGALSISCGTADYINVFNAVTQVPKGAFIYMYGINSYWYMPKNK